jgi:hypothetical protein
VPGGLRSAASEPRRGPYEPGWSCFTTALLVFSCVDDPSDKGLTTTGGDDAVHIDPRGMPRAAGGLNAWSSGSGGMRGGKVGGSNTSPANAGPAGANAAPAQDSGSLARAVRSSVAFASGKFALDAGESLVVGDVRVELSAEADFRVLDSSGALLWHSGTNSVCDSTASCRIAFQTDGNLVTTRGSEAIWSCGTWGNPGAVLRFSNQAEYVLISAGDGTELWSSWPAPDPALDLGAPPLERRSGAGYDYVTHRANQFRMNSGASIALGGTIVRVTAAGAVQVLDVAHHVLWTSGGAAVPCPTEGCGLVFHANGDLVLHGAGDAALWASGTGANPGAYLTLSSEAPYLRVYGADFALRWTSSGVRGSGSARPARAVQRFLDSLGVNVHMTQYEHDAAQVSDKLDYLGIQWIRDGFRSNYSLEKNYRTLSERGVKVNLLLGGGDDFGALMVMAETLNGMAPDFLGSIEGPNEINNFPFHCGGNTWHGGWGNDNGPAALCYATRFYNALANTPSLENVRLFALTGAESAKNAETLTLLDIKDKADYANIHPYPKNGAQPLDTILRNLREAFRDVTPEHAVITEIGYTGADVSERAQAILVVNAWLDAFERGFWQTFVYELSDNPAERYGFFDVHHQPKAVADVTHRLTAILNDPGPAPAVPGSLDYSLTGFAGREILLQKSSRVFDLILWEEPLVVSAGKDVYPADKTVHVEFGGARSKVEFFDPYSPTGGVSVQQWHDVSAVDIPLGDHAIVLEVTP